MNTIHEISIGEVIDCFTFLQKSGLIHFLISNSNTKLYAVTNDIKQAMTVFIITYSNYQYSTLKFGHQACLLLSHGYYKATIM